MDEAREIGIESRLGGVLSDTGGEALTVTLAGDCRVRLSSQAANTSLAVFWQGTNPARAHRWAEFVAHAASDTRYLTVELVKARTEARINGNRLEEANQEIESLQEQLMATQRELEYTKELLEGYL